MTVEANSQIRDRILKSSVRQAMDQIGDRWTSLIFLGAFYGFTRFDQWMQRYNMSSSVLSNRLVRLQDNKLLRKEQIEGSRRYHYILTEAGRALLPWALASWNWENLWVYQDDRHPVSLVHSKCGNITQPKYLCAHCHDSVHWPEIILKDGPGINQEIMSTTPNFRRSSVSTDTGEGGQNFGRILDILGDRWSYLLISAALYRIRRFDDFLKELEIAPGILSDRLRRLVDHGLLARSRYQDKPARWEYILTEKTFDFAMVAVTLGQWGDKWLSSPTDLPILRFHKSCGMQLEMNLVCSCCDEILYLEDVSFELAASDPKKDPVYKKR